MSKIKVLNTVIFKGCEERLEKLSEVAVVKSIDANRNDVLEIIHDYDVYFSSLAFRFDKEIIDKAKKLKLVVSPSTGTDHIDKKYLLSKGIQLFDLSKEFKVINGFSHSLVSISKIKKVAAYHQYYAVQKAVNQTIRATDAQDGDRKVGGVPCTISDFG